MEQRDQKLPREYSVLVSFLLLGQNILAVTVILSCQLTYVWN